MAASASAQVARTPWGDPDLQGAYTNSDESLIPMERPESLSGKTLTDISAEELARLNEQRNEQREEADRQRWELRSPLHWFENLKPKNSRAWLVVDPADGRIPPQTEEARRRAAARAQARRGEADSYEDRSLYDRCITRGIPGSMMPAIYGNSYEIVQGPGFVEWSVTFDDPATWTRPWTFAMILTRTSEHPFEYACHEGNFAMRNILSIAREEEKAAGR